ncbi:putative NRPS-like enzyme [Podospora didyma]|uniref:NRPS-like enzyme n=1 Tax=Podospora didyma TaxID=330526 RepID=A0AAE0NXA4_9PEZI|nr:putative NRPS-like enzyme [Podospora didyma]
MPVIDTRKDLAALFIEQVDATPDAVALEDEICTYTYVRLERETATLADRLHRLGVGRDSLVGILLGHSCNYVVACLAALRAGGAFLVLELAHPPNLLARVINDAKPTVIITSFEHEHRISKGVMVPTIVLGQDSPDSEDTRAATPLGDASSPTDLDKLAFVSYSSGTTGQPKGIANPHSAPIRSYDLRFELSDLRPGDRVACNVFFVWEMLRPLIRGATVYAVPNEFSSDPEALVDVLSSRRITETLMTPTLLAIGLARYPNLGSKLADLQTMWLNGEVVTTDLARQAIKALPKTRLLNCYSASETHEIACGDIRDMLALIDDDAVVCPVGPPMDAEHIYILNEEGDRVPQGEIGELYVGGRLLARGYLGLPEATADAFIKDPFDPAEGARMYRTGDLARLLPNGYLEITGRVGAMIKMRGYSVQPPAVEAAILKNLAVKQCVVIGHGEGLDRQIVAYVIREKNDAELGGRTVFDIDGMGFSPEGRDALAPHLALYMIPTLWVELHELPTHPVSGKIDLKSLPPPPTPNDPESNSQNLGESFETPISRETVAELWAVCLKLPVSAVMQGHNFFDLGGHSLSMATLAGSYATVFTLWFPRIERLMENPTLDSHVEILCNIRQLGLSGMITPTTEKRRQVLRLDLLRRDAILPEHIKPARPESTTMLPLNEARAILLTGATGFLGAFLLHEILERTTARVICLVRSSDPNSSNARPEGMARLRKNLLDFGVWHDSVFDRVEILPGNVDEEDFGLRQGDYEELVLRVKTIVHAAAKVNLVYEYASLYSDNVLGTREILRFAAKSGATLHHISTNGVFPPSGEEEDDGWPEDVSLALERVVEQISDGYGQSKWVAEQLVLEAIRRGVPAKIYRPGTISGHSISGASNPSDFLFAFIIECLRLGKFPNTRSWRAEMTPVDFVSKAIVALAMSCNNTPQVVFHIGDSHPLPTAEIFDMMSQLGYPMKQVSWKEWSATWELHARRSEATDPISDIVQLFMLSKAEPTTIVLDGPATEPILLSYGLERPTIDIILLATYARHLYSRGSLLKPPQRTATHLDQILPAPSSSAGALTGRVAVVTGASSGIGAAVALALAREGAHVALAARRTDALESVKRQCLMAGRGGRVLVHPTDVTDKARVGALMASAEAALGPMDILVACAGVMYYTLMENVQTNQWEQMVDVNCKGLLHCLSATVPGMLSRGRGHIVAISSDAGRKVFPGLGVYSASKFFVEATLQSLRVETAGKGLRVTSVQPGNTTTDLLAMSTDAAAVEKYGQPTGAKVLSVGDVADAVLYALKQPDHVAVNEVLIEPRDEPI